MRIKDRRALLIIGTGYNPGDQQPGRVQPIGVNLADNIGENRTP